MRDAEVESQRNETCRPWEVDYASGLRGDTDAIVADCNIRNIGNNCAVRACILEGWFITNIFTSIFGATQFDVTKKHSDPDFNEEEQCVTTPSTPSEHSCCGMYPFRHEYKTYGGARGCCGAKTYDISILTCCSDGKPRLTCPLE